MDYVGQTARALHEAHLAGMVHRDVKPGNLLVTPEGRIKITDFGIARVADQVALTATGQVMGTVQYLAPEQATGKPPTPATDIYSLGVVAYEALTGKRPFTGENQMAIAMAQINDPPPPLPENIPEPVRQLVLKCLEKKPNQRFESALILARDAEALSFGTGRTSAGAATTKVLKTASASEGAATAVIDTAKTAEAPKAPVVWPWVALIALLAISGLAIGIAIIGDLIRDSTPSPSPSASPSSSASSPTGSASPSASPSSPTEVMVLLSNIQQKSVSEVTIGLEGLGLVVDAVPGDSLPADDPRILTVYAAEPLGLIPVGSTVKIYYYVQRLETATPTPTATPTATPTVDPSASPSPSPSE
jgi:serine/threonine-protein kinase